MDFGVNFAASAEAVRQAQRAEELGYAFIGFYDSPALEADVWITIANALQATRKIHVGAEVLVPHLRHPMAQAAAIATLEMLAPGRLFVGVGTGFTGRMAMGQRALTWTYMSSFLREVKQLLAGDKIVVDGGVTQMLHPPGFGAQRPIRTPFLVAANGPKGVEVARQLGDGLMYNGKLNETPTGFSVLQLFVNGILREDGENPASARLIEAAKPWFGMQYHLAYGGFHHGVSPVEDLPHGGDWLRLLEAFPEEERHLHVHAAHTVSMNALDAAFAERHPDALAAFAERNADTPQALREKAGNLAALGATRICCRTGFVDWDHAMTLCAKTLGLEGKA